jgi:cardiolipin synthase
MIPSLRCEETMDLRGEPLGPGWLRRAPTTLDPVEVAGPGVWRTGPQLQFRDELVAAINSATEIVLVCSFLLSDERLAHAMLRAAERNVRVYVLTASEQRIGKLVREDEAFEQRMMDEHKRLLEALAGEVMLRSAEHIHAKFVVVLPKAPNPPRALLSTANFNKALSDSVELGVELDGTAARALASWFQWAFWCEAERELRGQRRLVEVRAQHPAVPTRPQVDPIFGTLRGANVLRERLLALIRGAHSEILVATYGMSADHATIQELLAALRRGVRVTVITRPRRAVAAAAAVLATAGALVVAHDKLHAKALVVDGQAVVMTANLESQGLDAGFEVGAMLPVATARVVEATLRGWASSFPWVYRHDARRGDHVGDFCPAEANLRDAVVRVTEVHSQSLAALTALDALRLHEADAPALRPPELKGELPRRVKFTWEVVPPAVPKDARERRRTIEREEHDKDGKQRVVREQVSYQPPVFEHRGVVYVQLRSLDEAAAASRLAAELGGVVAT